MANQNRAGDMSSLSRPIFVGGVSRSGTTVVGKRLLGRHSEIGCVKPAEMWFITDRGGLCDVAHPEINQIQKQLLAIKRGNLNQVAAFNKRMRGFWYGRQWKRQDKLKGLHETVSPEQLENALELFNSNFKQDSVEAARQLAADLIDPYIVSKNKTRWVDTTPRNVRRADALLSVFPDLKLIHMIRDGRDVASSIVSMNWGPNNIHAALEQWYLHIQEGQIAAAKLPAHQVLTMQLEDLVENDREASYQSILNFLEVDDAPKMRKYFDEEMSVSNAHKGRWKTGLSQADVEKLNLDYMLFCESLKALGLVIPK